MSSAPLRHLTTICVALLFARAAQAQIDEIPVLVGRWHACFTMDSTAAAGVHLRDGVTWPVCGSVTFRNDSSCGDLMTYDSALDLIPPKPKAQNQPPTVAVRTTVVADSLWVTFGGFTEALPLARPDVSTACRISADDGSLSGMGWLAKDSLRGEWSLATFGSSSRMGTFWMTYSP